ncbi:hypothetical protein AG4045_009866 [Apium graveolens]|uniref:Uncharacterized protein n=1 Tax=Apium graveolens TaxID=4045 RepID=A0A6L5B7N6_APIGR|nr:hypothetical protein AG4045_009866 [Apium graveolens]
MDSLSIHKIQAINNPFWYPPLRATVNVFLSVSLPKVLSLFLSAKAVFIVGEFKIYTIPQPPQGHEARCQILRSSDKESGNPEVPLEKGQRMNMNLHCIQLERGTIQLVTRRHENASVYREGYAGRKEDHGKISDREDPFWYPPLRITVHVFLFVSLPKVISLFFSAKFVFILGEFKKYKVPRSLEVHGPAVQILPKSNRERENSKFTLEEKGKNMKMKLKCRKIVKGTTRTEVDRCEPQKEEACHLGAQNCQMISIALKPKDSNKFTHMYDETLKEGRWEQKEEIIQVGRMFLLVDGVGLVQIL